MSLQDSKIAQTLPDLVDRGALQLVTDAVRSFAQHNGVTNMCMTDNGMTFTYRGRVFVLTLSQAET